MKYSDTYAGSMDSNYGEHGTQIPLFMNQYMGAPTSATTPLQLPQVTQLAASGIMNVEVGTIDPQQFERIPQKHFTEMKQLAKLQGVQLSMHAPPVLDTAGFEQNRWSEEVRKNAEVYMRDFLEKAAMLQSEEGVKVPMVMHASGHTPAKDNLHWDKDALDFKTGQKGKWVADVLVVVNPETGQLAPLEREERYYPQSEKPVAYTPEKRLSELNRSQWDQVQMQVANYYYELEETKRRVGEMRHRIAPYEAELKAGTLSKEDKARVESEIQSVRTLQSREALLGQYLQSAIVSGFDKVYRSKDYWDPEIIEPTVMDIYKQEKLKENYEKFYKELPGMRKQFIDKYDKQIQPLIEKYHELERAGKSEDANATLQEYERKMTQYGSDIFNTFTDFERKGIVPQTFVPVERFAKQKAPMTWANAMYDTYKNLEARKKSGEKVGEMPVLAVENWDIKYPMGMADDLREGIKKAREIFVDRATKDGKSEEWAKSFAKEHIGATWDVGHINFLRKYMGANIPEKERRDIIAKESAKIAPDLKHMHLHDNFGFQDVHLPPGAGNVPFKEIMAEMEKAGKTGKVRKILESYAAVAELKYNPHQETLTHLGVPLYSGTAGGTSWGQWNNYFFGSHGYLPGYGDMLPQVHFSMYGAGFSQLPTAVGGQVGGGDRSKFAGTPMS